MEGLESSPLSVRTNGECGVATRVFPTLSPLVIVSTSQTGQIPSTGVSTSHQRFSQLLQQEVVVEILTALSRREIEQRTVRGDHVKPS